MTITDTGRQAVDELLPAARELAAQEGVLPSKDRLMKTFRIGRPKAGQLLTGLAAEDAAKRERRRRAMPRVRARKGPVRGLRAPSGVLLAAPIAPDAGLVAPGPPPQVSPAPEGAAVLMHAPLPKPSSRRRRSVRRWPLLLLALPAFVAIWSGWVGLGGLTGFGVVHPLPGIADEVSLNTAITLPIGLETYAAYALYAWLSGAIPARARRFAMWSAIGSLVLGAGGQITYHLLVSTGPWLITTIVACLPVAVLGMGAALYHLVSAEEAE